MIPSARLPAVRSPIWAVMAVAILVTAGCDEVTPVAIGTSPARTSLPSPVAAATPVPRVAEAIPIPSPTSTSIAGRSPGPTATQRTSPTSRREAFSMSLYRKGDYVSQYTLEWCVGASLQMTLNMVTDETRTSRASQQQLWEMAQARSNSPFGGANPRGWTDCPQRPWGRAVYVSSRSPTSTRRCASPRPPCGRQGDRWGWSCGADGTRG